MPALILVLSCLIGASPQVHEQDPPLSPAEKRIISLIRASVSNDEAKARQAQESLVRMGAPAVPLLHQALEEEKDRSYTLLYILSRIYQEQAGEDWRESPSRREKDRAAARRYLRRRFDEAEALHHSGQYQTAFRILEGILALEPKIHFRDEVLALRDQVKAGIYQTTVLSVSFEAEREVYEAGEVIEVHIRLYNPGMETVVIPVGKEGVNAGMLNLERWTYSPDGSWHREIEPHPLRLPEEIRMEPGDDYTLPFLIDTRGMDLQKGFYGRLWLTGRLRPPTVLQGEENRGRLVRIPPIEIPLLPKGQASLGDDPAAALEMRLGEDRTLFSEKSGLGKADSVRRREIIERLAVISSEVYPLAFLAAREDLWKANRTLVGSLDDASPGTAEAAMRALSILNGKRLGLDKGRWQIWWFKVR